MTDYTELKRLAGAATKSKWCTDGERQVMSAESDQLNSGFVIVDCQGPDNLKNAAFIAAANPAAVLVLIAENEALIQALQAITAQVEGNIRPTVRDCVNGQNNVQDIYGCCDQIESIAAAAMKEPQP